MVTSTTIIQYIPYEGVLPEYKRFAGRIIIEYGGTNVWRIYDSLRSLGIYNGTELIEVLDEEADKWEKVYYERKPITPEKVEESETL